MTARSIKERLKAGEKVLAGWVYGLSPVTAEIMALAGYSALLIDQEHGPTELQMIHSQTVAAEARGAQVMVRVPSHDPNHVKRLLDMGISSVMFPMVDSVADAEAVVRWIEEPTPGAEEPANPAAVLTLTPQVAPSAVPAARPADAVASDGSDGDSVAVGLGVAGLVAGLAGLGLGGAAFARTRRRTSEQH